MQEMSERLLMNEHPVVPTQEDLTHSQGCPCCQAFLKRMSSLETNLDTWRNVSLEHVPQLRPFNPQTGTFSPGPTPESAAVTSFFHMKWIILVIAGAVLYLIADTQPPTPTNGTDKQSSNQSVSQSTLNENSEAKGLGNNGTGNPVKHISFSPSSIHNPASQTSNQIEEPLISDDPSVESILEGFKGL